MAKQDELEVFRFLLLGKTGCGKSTTGNTILGEDLFDSDVSFESVTSKCSLKRVETPCRMIEIMDSPGLFDTTKPHEEITSLVMQSVACMHPGPDAVLYVMKIGRYTDEEYGVYTRLKALLDESVTKYLIVLFTHGDSLKGKHIRDILDKVPPKLKTVMEESNYRYAVMDNIGKPPQQVDDLLKLVKEMRSKNGQPYICPKYASIGGKMEEEVQRRMADVEKRELQSKKHVQQLTANLEQSKEMAEKEKAEFQKREEERRQEIEAQRKKMEEEMKKLADELKDKDVSEEQQRKQMEDMQNQIKAAEQKQLEENERRRKEEKERLEKMKKDQEEAMKKLEAEKNDAAEKMANQQKQQMNNLKDEISRLEASKVHTGGGGGGCTIL